MKSVKSTSVNTCVGTVGTRITIRSTCTIRSTHARNYVEENVTGFRYHACVINDTSSSSSYWWVTYQLFRFIPPPPVLESEVISVLVYTWWDLYPLSSIKFKMAFIIWPDPCFACEFVADCKFFASLHVLVLSVVASFPVHKQNNNNT